MSKIILGLEIEQHSVTAVLLEKEHKDHKLLAHKQLPLDAGDETADSLQEVLKKLVDEMNVDGAQCLVSIPAHLMSFRNLQLPFTDEKKINQVLPYELESLLPVGVDDLIIDFKPYSFAEQENSAHLLTVSAAKSTIAAYLEPLAANSIDPQVLTISGYGSLSWLIAQPDVASELIFIQLKDSMATVFFVMARELTHIRAFSLQGTNVSKDDLLFSKLRQTLISFDQLAEKTFEPEVIVISGGDPLLTDFAQKVQRFLNIPVSPLRVADSVQVTLYADQQQNWDAERFEGVLALALLKGKAQSHFNFRKGPFEIKKKWGEHKDRIITTAILLSCVIVLGLSNYLLNYSRLRSRMDAYETRINKIFYQIFPEGAKRTDRPSLQVEHKIQEMKEVSKNKAEPERTMLTIDILNEISRAFTKDIKAELTNLVIGVEHTLISGETDSHNSVNTIKNNLEKVAGFSRVTIVKSELDKRGSGVQFRLKIQF